MTRCIPLWALSAICLSAPVTVNATAQHATQSSALDGFIEANRALATQSSASGIDALASAFSPEVRMFVFPVAGFATGRAQALDHLRQAFGTGEVKLGMAPMRYGISADGKQAFSFGYTDGDTAEGKKLGKYLAYWVRGDAGWQIALFKIVPRGEGAITHPSMDPALPAAGWRSARKAHAEPAKAALIAREAAFSEQAQRIGLGPAFAEFGSGDAVNAGGEVEFVVGNTAIGDLHGTGPSPFRWSADDALVSGSGDLGVTWGTLLRNGPTPPGRSATIPFFTVWRRSAPDAPWLYVAE